MVTQATVRNKWMALGRVAIGLLAALLARSVWGQVEDTLVFDFSGPDPARNVPWAQTSVLAPDWSTTGWTLGPGLGLVASADDRLAFTAIADGELTTLESALATGQFLSLSLSAPGLAGHRITFTIRRESWHAPLRYAVLSDVDQFSEPLYVSRDLENSDEAEDTFTFLLPDDGWEELAGPVEFRLVPYAALWTGHAASLTQFAIQTAAAARRLTLEVSEGGTAEISPNRTLFEQGEIATLRASPGTGYRFLGWEGDATGLGNPRSLVVDRDIHITAVFARKASPRMELGGNLDSLSYFATAWVFQNCFKMARPWLTRDVGSFDWDSGHAVPTDGDGWPLQIPFTPEGAVPQIAHTLVPLYASGAYTVRFEGTGRIHIHAPGGDRMEFENSGGVFETTRTFQPDSDFANLLFEIHQSSDSDPVRNIEILAPGSQSVPELETFHPQFVESLAPYRVLRFMDWQRTNGSPVEDWSEHPPGTYFTQGVDEGASHEIIVQLCNSTGKHPWICIPHRANDDYIQRTAELYRDRLRTNLVLYVEYSNETWNNMPDFTQTDYVIEQGLALGLDTDPYAAGNKFVARRSAEIFHTFEQVFGIESRHRLVFVLATQAGFVDGVTRPRINAILDPEINPTGTYPDALAIAPYFGVNFQPVEGTGGLEEPVVDPMPTVDEMLESMSLPSIAESRVFTEQHRILADEQGWRLLCYEGGQHFTGIFGAENNATLMDRIFEANRDSRMHTRYLEYLEGLQEAGADLFANFIHVAPWSKWGTWGVLETQDQAASEAPKWRALLDWNERIGPAHPILGWQQTGPSPEYSSLQFELRPDRIYQLRSSTNLIQWTPVDGWENLRGADIRLQWNLSPTDPGSPHRFWLLHQME